MKSSFASLLGLVARLTRHIFPLQPRPALSPDEFRKMLEEAMSDPETRWLLLRSFVTQFPIQGGTPSANYIPKYTDSAGTLDVTATPIFEKDGNKIGIGTTSPGMTLDVRGAPVADSDLQSILQVVNNSTAYGNNPRVSIAFATKHDSAGNIAGFGGILVGKENATEGNLNSYLALITRGNADGNLERLRITSSGKVGIGTASPGNILTVSQTAVGSEARLSLSNPDNTNGASHAQLIASVGGTSAGDPAIIFDISGTTDWTAGIDNSDADKFKIATAIGVRSNARLTIDTAGNVGIGTTSPGKKLTVYDGGQTIQEVGDNEVNSIVSGITVRMASQLFPLPVTNQQTSKYSTGLYVKVDIPTTDTKNIFGIFGEVSSQPSTGYGGFLGVHHKGLGDACYIALLETGGVALEAATYANGTKGIISTLQEPGTAKADSTLFTALWDSSTPPNYGMFYAQKSEANALLIEKRTSNDDSQTQIRVTDSGPGRERFGVLNDGTIRASSKAATSGSQTPDSPPLVLRGAYWNGSASVDCDWAIQNIVFSTSAPRSRLAFLDPSESPVERLTIQDDGNVGIGNISPKFVLHTSGAAVALGAPSSAPTDSNLNNSNISFFLDQVNHRLKVRVKYSDGTLKTGEIILT